MAAPSVRRAYQVFHALLGLGLLTLSLQTFVHAVREFHGSQGHYVIVGGLEAIGAALFLIPRTLKVGSVLLLLVLLGVLAVHTWRGELRIDLIVYAAGVWLVMDQGAAWGTR